jgi:hypothetical protein
MASGKLGSADLSAATDTLLYTVPASVTATVNIRIANRNSGSIKVRVAVGSGASPAATDYLSYDATVPANSMYEDTAVVLTTGEKVWVRSDTANVSARVHGIEG